MAVLPLRYDEDPVLHQVAEPIRKINKEIKALIDDMFETMYAANGVGLAAPQIGRSLRLFVIDTGDREPFALVNPVLEKGWGEITEQEGCLSFPGLYKDVKRYQKVRFSGRNEKDRHVVIEATGLLARALQHELDHLDGKVFIDLVEGDLTLSDDLAALRRRLAEAKQKGVTPAELIEAEEAAEAEPARA